MLAAPTILSALLLLSLPLAAPAAVSDLERLRVLLVIDSRSNLGPSVEEDQRHFEWLLLNHIPKKQITLDTLKSKEVTREKILAYYRTLKTGPNECFCSSMRDMAAWNPTASIISTRNWAKWTGLAGTRFARACWISSQVWWCC